MYIDIRLYHLSALITRDSITLIIDHSHINTVDCCHSVFVVCDFTAINSTVLLFVFWSHVYVILLFLVFHKIVIEDQLNNRSPL